MFILKHLSFISIMNSRERVTRLILRYPVLWNPLHLNYRDKTMKTRAREELLVKVNRIPRVQITMADLKKKISNFCTNRRRKMIRWQDGIASDPSQCIVVQRQYLMLSHARYCVERERRGEYHGEPCSRQYCPSMKGLINHMETCRAGDFCTTPDCRSSGNIMQHWTMCREVMCPLCSPRKEWHNTITTAHRNHIIDILLQCFSWNSISPSIYCQLLCAGSLESGSFKMAKSRSEYYRAVADKIWRFEETHLSTESTSLGWRWVRVYRAQVD